MKKHDLLQTWAVKHNDIQVRMSSRSGGIFTALSDRILEQNGVVYGAKLSDDCRSVQHERATTFEERNSFRGSKYIQSRLGDTFSNVKMDLENDKYVLFSGTPCQIGGLLGYLGKEYKKLITLDVVCHGVSSPLVWEEYLDWLEKKYKDTVVSADFRDKRKYGWGHHMETIEFTKKVVSANWYANIFYSHNAIRPSCFNCPYRTVERISDISIADCWGIAKNMPQFNDNKGVSLVLINTNKGLDLFEKCQNEIESQQVNIKNYMQPALHEVDKIPKSRDDFWRIVQKKGVTSSLLRRYGGYTLKKRIRRKIDEFKERY